VREDGAWIDAGENDNAIVQTLTRTPGSLGVFGFSFLEQNLDTVKAETIDGIAPTAETIADGSYPTGSQPLHLRQEGAHRRDPGPAAVPVRVHVRRCDRSRAAICRIGVWCRCRKTSSRPSAPSPPT
jgi:ABC-type phosphate transport system substrate-binding protein